MDNCVISTRRLFLLLGVPNTLSYIENSILSHPDHPSLAAIKETLEKYQIKNLAVKISAHKLHELPLPCIVQIDEHGKKAFCVLVDISKEKISYFDSNDQLIHSAIKKFIEVWTGVCLLAETSNEMKEPGIEKKIISIRVLGVLKAFLLLLITIWVFAVFLSANIEGGVNNKICAVSYTILKILGLGAGGLLLWFEVDEYNPTLQSFCLGGENSKINCNAVLNSKHAQLFRGNLSLSVLGFSYFFCTLLTMIVSDFSSSSLSLLAYLSLFTMPVILFSAYYQALVIKQWCKFCIIIQTLLLLEIVTILFSDFYKGSFLPSTGLSMLILFISPILGWKLIKPLLKTKKEISLYKRMHGRIKNNPDILNLLLSKSRKILTPSEGLGISLKNVDAKYNLVKVCNPYCEPCARAHPILKELFRKGIINLQILFVANLKNEYMVLPIRHFLAIDSIKDLKKTQSALDYWYNLEQKDYQSFAKIYPLNGELAEQDDKISQMHVWCKTENITRTPTLFINGHELPKEYSIEDLTEVLTK